MRTVAALLVLCVAAPAAAQVDEVAKVVTDAGAFLEPSARPLFEAEKTDLGISDVLCKGGEEFYQALVAAECLDKDHKDEKVVCAFGTFPDCSMDDVCHNRNGCGYFTDSANSFVKVTGYSCSQESGTASSFKGKIGCDIQLTGLSWALIVIGAVVFLSCCCGCLWCVCKKCC